MATTVAVHAGATSERRFYSAMALAFLAVVLAGFSRTFFLRPLFPDRPVPPEPIFLIHGATAAAWILLFLVQARLVANDRTRLHRRLGAWAGAALAVLIVVLGVQGALVAAARPGGFIGVPVPPLQFLTVPLFDITLFGTFVAMAIARRRDLQAHKRWMLLATVNLLPAALARVPNIRMFGGPLAFLWFTDLFVLALVAWDVRSRGRLHPATLLGGGLIVASQPLRLLVGGTEPWLAFARWATG
jgi:hypothetical protein